MNTKELPTVGFELVRKPLKKRIGPWIAVGILSGPAIGVGIGLVTRPTVSLNEAKSSISAPSQTLGEAPVEIFPSATDCNMNSSPAEGYFNRNSGIQRLSASGDHESIAVVTPDYSNTQQAAVRLMDDERRGWVIFDEEQSTGILIRTNTPLALDTSNDHGALYKSCGPDKVAVDEEIPKSVGDIFSKFGFDKVVVYTIHQDGYIKQVVPHGQGYATDIPWTYVPF